MTEKQIEQKLTKLVRARGGMTYKFTSPNAAGVPDRIVIAPGGRVVFVELKADDGRVSDLQGWQIARMCRLGVDARVLKGWMAVKEFIDEVLPA